MAFYQLLTLREGSGISIDENRVIVELSEIPSGGVVRNDADLTENAHPEDYFWLSGGGTFLFQGRYLLLVRRAKDAKTNPGKFSVFTGRSEGLAEWIEPWKVVRELFEEVLMFRNGGLLKPRNERYQAIIDDAYGNHFQRLGCAPTECREIEIEELLLEGREVIVKYSGKAESYDFFVVVTDRREINVVTLFSVDLDPLTIDFEDNEEVERPRATFLLDLQKSRVAGEWILAGQDGPISLTEMSENLKELLGALMPLLAVPDVP